MPGWLRVDVNIDPRFPLVMESTLDALNFRAAQDGGLQSALEEGVST